MKRNLFLLAVKRVARREGGRLHQGRRGIRIPIGSRFSRPENRRRSRERICRENGALPLGTTNRQENREGGDDALGKPGRFPR